MGAGNGAASPRPIGQAPRCNLELLVDMFSEHILETTITVKENLVSFSFSSSSISSEEEPFLLLEPTVKA